LEILLFWKQVREFQYFWVDSEDPKTTPYFNECMKISSGFASVVNVCGDGGASIVYAVDLEERSALPRPLIGKTTGACGTCR
jgi:hypothetical protein